MNLNISWYSDNHSRLNKPENTPAQELTESIDSKNGVSNRADVGLHNMVLFEFVIVYIDR